MPKKPSRKKPQTPRSRVRSALRRVWLMSRERAAALKLSGHKCEACGELSVDRKGGTVKLEVHHLNGIEWENIIDYVFRHILVDPKELEVLCKDCHAKEHETEEAKVEDTAFVDKCRQVSRELHHENPYEKIGALLAEVVFLREEIKRLKEEADGSRSSQSD